MNSEKDSYKQIFKTTSIFGGLQVFNILISVLKSKIIAVLLGPAGLGIISIFTSTSAVIASCTNMGINVSAVKSIASSGKIEGKNHQSIIIAVTKKMIWLSGLLGLLVTVILSPWLSKISFGTTSYSFSFVLLGLSLLALQVSSGQNAILQGLRQVKLIALSSLTGAFIGLALSVPLYIFLGAEGIVPALVATSMAGVLTSWHFLKKVEIPIVKVNFKTVKREGKSIIKLGFLISLTSIFPAIGAYVARLFIANVGNIEDVGLFTSGFAIIGTYVGMVFSAISTDYYPSLAEVANDNIKCTEKVNQQTLVSILVLAPILTILLVFIKLGIVILYSEKFLGTVKLIQWASLGIFFQAFSFCIAYLFLAKGHSKLYFWNELIPNIYVLILNCLCYYTWGLEGMGISFLIGYFLYFIQVYIVAKIKYGFEFDLNTLKICSSQLLILITTFILTYYLVSRFSYIIGFLLIIISTLISSNILEKKIGFISMIKKRMKS